MGKGGGGELAPMFLVARVETKDGLGGGPIAPPGLISFGEAREKGFGGMSVVIEEPLGNGDRHLSVIGEAAWLPVRPGEFGNAVRAEDVVNAAVAAGDVLGGFGFDGCAGDVADHGAQEAAAEFFSRWCDHRD